MKTKDLLPFIQIFKKRVKTKNVHHNLVAEEFLFIYNTFSSGGKYTGGRRASVSVKLAKMATPTNASCLRIGTCNAGRLL